MNTLLVKSVPLGDFVEISVLTRGWETELHALVNQKLPIKFDIYPRSGIPLEIQSLLQQQGYSSQVPKNDRWQHFLVPNSIQPAAVQI